VERAIEELNAEGWRPDSDMMTKASAELALLGRTVIRNGPVECTVWIDATGCVQSAVRIVEEG
jgi:hypothetical protein